MTSLPAIPTALDLLEQQLRQGAEADALLLPLRALQFRGLSKTDLTIQVERVRAVNEATGDDDAIADACLLALEIIDGQLPAHRLHWDSAHIAASLIARVLSEGDLRAALDAALEPSDLLPPRGTPALELKDLLDELAPLTLQSLQGFDVTPTTCASYRAPKSAFTTRPAALLRLPDRLALEALVKPVAPVIANALPDTVVWPRHRFHKPAVAPQDIVRGWQSDYVVKADVSDFYASVEHATLATFLARHGEMPVLNARALEALLGAVMGSNRGLPQGPQVSDVLASAYLLPIDQHLNLAPVEYIRFADDFYFPAASLSESRDLLHMLEALLEDVGLVLNDAKTRVMRRETFETGRRKPLEDVERLRELAVEPPEDDAEMLQALEAAGVDEQTLWELAYHHTVSLDDVVESLVEDRVKVVAEFYAEGLSAAADSLSGGVVPPDMAGVESLAREGLAFLTSAPEVAMSEKRLVTLLRWFPGLAPRLVELLRARAESQPNWVDSVLRLALRDVADDEWVSSWLAFVAGATGSAGRDSSVRRLLERLSNDAARGELARAEAVKALMISAQATPSAWRAVFANASAPLRGEMMLAALAARRGFELLSVEGDKADSSALWALVAQLPPRD